MPIHDEVARMDTARAEQIVERGACILLHQILGWMLAPAPAITSVIEHQHIQPEIVQKCSGRQRITHGSALSMQHKHGSTALEAIWKPPAIKLWLARVIYTEMN